MSRYGLTSIGNGVYQHRSGAVILQTDGWEGPRSSRLKRWEIGRVEADGTPLVGEDGALYTTLREAAAELDAREEASGAV